MPIKDGRWNPATCATTWPMFTEEQDPDDITAPAQCDGHMELVDVKINGGKVEHFSEEDRTGHTVSPPILTKVWACNKCGYVFEE